METFKRGSHTPAHFMLDNMPYFITGAIYHKRLLLQNANLKTALLELLHTYFAQYHWSLEHWVILDNHYHLLGKSAQGSDLPAIFMAVHSRSAKLIRQITSCDLPVWWNYWDYCPRDEAGYLTRLNYLLNNPVKHGYVSDLHNYPFSSFHTLFQAVGREQLATQFRQYPYRDLILTEAEDDDF